VFAGEQPDDGAELAAELRADAGGEKDGRASPAFDEPADRWAQSQYSNDHSVELHPLLNANL